MRYLLERLENHKAEILRFIYDWSVPFTNNEAERSIRFSKVKQKVFGCFRTKGGASEYAETMSYINSARKHDVSYFDAVKAVLKGEALALAYLGITCLWKTPPLYGLSIGVLLLIFLPFAQSVISNFFSLIYEATKQLPLINK